jgi:hypothetical protein
MSNDVYMGVDSEILWLLRGIGEFVEEPTVGDPRKVEMREGVTLRVSTGGERG